MSFKLKVMPLAVAQVIAGGAFSMMAIAPVMAQQVSNAPATQSADQQPVQRIEITGSNIRRADSETPSPVQVITADDMKKSGYTSIVQVLQNITANGQGTLSQASPSSFAAGASGIALRGLDTAATLVLIDGHRMAPFPLADNAQFSFVDISNIPFDTIERVEVLKDGASAVYGSDAMAGVVNIILKKNFVGTTVNAEGSGTTEGGGGTVHASVTHGMGDFDADGYNAYVSLEYRHQDPISLAQRQGDGLAFDSNLNSIGGVNKTPGVISPIAPNPVTRSPYLTAQNSTSDAVFGPGATCSNAQLNSAAGCAWQSPIDLSPETQNVNLLASFSKKLDDGWRLDVKASLFDSEAYLVGNPATFPQSYSQGSSAGGLAVNANNPGTLVGPGSIPAIQVPANYPGNTLGAPAYIYGVIPGSPNQINTVESKASRLVADLSGSIGEWDIKSSLGYTKVATSQDYNFGLNIPALNAAINRPVNPFNVFSNTNSAADLAAIFPSTNAYDTSLLEFAELHASRSLMQLPAGDLGFSAGTEFVHRDLQAPAPMLASEGQVSLNNAYASGAQNDGSAYVEFAVPVLKTLEVDADARIDHFDTVGNAHTGKLAFKWSPNDVFALRGAASNGFRAPNTSESGQAGAFAFAAAGYDPVYCPGGLVNGVPPKGAAINVNGNNLCNYQPTALSVANPNLQPERSTSFTLGTILEPIKGWSSTVDLYKITVRDQIVSPQLNYATATPVRSTTPVSAVCSDGTATGTEPCPNPVYPVLYYPNPFINANSTMTSGVELGTRYKFKLGDYGSLKAELDWTHVFSYVYTANGMSYQMVGTHGPEVISNDTGNPQDRVQAVFTWDRGPWQVATSFNWIGAFSLTDPSVGQNTCAGGAGNDAWFLGNTPTQSQYCKVQAFLDTDLAVRYTVNKQWTVHASATNLFNQSPPVDVETYGNGFITSADIAMHYAGVVGRTVNVGATYRF